MNLCRIAFSIFLVTSCGLAYTKCLPQNDETNNCRFAKGDSWCSKYGKGNLYSYSDRCLNQYNLESDFHAQKATSGKCAVTVRDDLMPPRVVVIVGCDGFDPLYLGGTYDNPSNGGITVLDADMKPLFHWTACSACGGFFERFVGVKKIRGYNALMIKMSNGPLMDSGGRAQPTIPLYFDGNRFHFADHSID